MKVALQVVAGILIGFCGLYIMYDYFTLPVMEVSYSTNKCSNIYDYHGRVLGCRSYNPDQRYVTEWVR